ASRTPSPTGTYTDWRRRDVSSITPRILARAASGTGTGIGHCRRYRWPQSPPELLSMIALKVLIGGPPEIFGPGEPLVRSIRIPSRRKLISEAGPELRVVPSALL